MQNNQYSVNFKYNPSFIKYFVFALLASLLAAASCVIRFVWCTNTRSMDAFDVAWFHLVCGGIVLAAFAGFLIAKTDNGKRVAACLSTLCSFAASVGLFAFDTLWRIHIDEETYSYSGITYRYFDSELVYVMDDPRIIFALVCGVLFVASLICLALDDRKEAGRAEKQNQKPCDAPAQKAATEQVEPDGADADAVEKLFKLKELLDAGILSEEEFEEAKETYRKKL